MSQNTSHAVMQQRHEAHDSLDDFPTPPWAGRMVKGRCDPAASTATSYCWLGWVHGAEPLPMLWIPPCRKALEREGDYA